jgi:hypothetical protein
MNLAPCPTHTHWTGPIGPIRLEGIAVPRAACVAEVRAIPATGWAQLTMHRPGARNWPVAWWAHTLRGHSRRATDPHSATTWRFGPATHGLSPEIPNEALHGLFFTDAAAASPACLAVAAAIPGESERIRVLRLGPGGILPKHRDPLHAPRWEDRTLVRFHVPLIVPDGCCFFAWDRHGQCHQICDPVGSIWFIDTDAPHMAVNASTEPRYHLVVDKFLDDELRERLVRLPGGEA